MQTNITDNMVEGGYHYGWNSL